MARSLKFGEKQAWIRFGIGLLGLGFSFLAALFSTALQQSGYGMFSAESASIALLIAGMVGLYIVPYLAKRAVPENWIDDLEYEVTKEGVVYLAAVMVIAIAALNTGNNLLFIMISAMLAAIVVSGIASALTLRKLTIELSLPEQVFARQPVIARMRLANGRGLPAFSIRVSSAENRRGRVGWQRTTFRFPPKRAKGEEWWTLADWKLGRTKIEANDESPLIDAIYFPYVKARRASHADVGLTFPKRGLYKQRALAVSTRFPFSFVKKTRKISLTREVIVLPELSTRERLFSELPNIAGDYESMVSGRGHDLYRIREQVPGDAARNIDWKATARSGGVMVREFTRDDDRRLRIVFDNPLQGQLRDRDYESMVSAAASLAWHFFGTRILAEYVSQEHHGTDLIDFLEYLALVSASKIPGHLPEITDDAFTLILTAGDWQSALSGCHVVRFSKTQQGAI